jgi:MFS family permease
MNLLISLPVLMVGLGNYILIPAAVAFGRRPVMIVCVLLATFCCLWSGLSGSLESHIASRCLQALGAAAVESLIPLILQDMTFVHQRSRAMSVIWASQVSYLLSIPYQEQRIPDYLSSAIGTCSFAYWDRSYLHHCSDVLEMVVLYRCYHYRSICALRYSFCSRDSMAEVSS